MTVDNIIIICYIGLTVGSFVWLLLHKVKMRRQRERFKQKLQGYKFGSYKELRQYWHGRLEFNFGKSFDPNRHGNLLKTLKTIDEKAQGFWDHWVS